MINLLLLKQTMASKNRRDFHFDFAESYNINKIIDGEIEPYTYYQITIIKVGFSVFI